MHFKKSMLRLILLQAIVRSAYKTKNEYLNRDRVQDRSILMLQYIIKISR